MKKGCVYLVGAGPGDPGLMTMKGKQVLARADVVVYDRLVGAGVLALIPAGAKRINVGKRSACHPVPQDEINRILLREAQSGACVVRLKGGDPFVFGRGGEELELLRENGVPFEVVPGITSAVAAAAYAGIPVTHRDFCSSVHIITGHARENGELHLDYEALVRLNGTLVFLMSVATVRAIAAGLLAAGMDPAMPAALVENGTRGDQRKLIAPLRAVADEAERQRIASPAVFLVGRVCALSQDFDWFSAKPLKGARVLVTQPAQKASAFADLLTERGAAVTLLPCIRICPREAPPLALEGIDAVLFTSAPGVEMFFAALQREGRDARALAGRIVACVGQKTAAEAARFGIRADFVPTTADGAHLAEELLQSGLLRAGARVLLARAAAGGEELPALLRAGGMAVTDLALYDTQLLPPRERPSPADFDFITFTSASCVEGFAGAVCGPGGNAFAAAAAVPGAGQTSGTGGAAESSVAASGAGQTSGTGGTAESSAAVSGAGQTSGTGSAAESSAAERFSVPRAVESSAAERFSIPRAAESSAAERLSVPGAASSAPAEPHSSKAPAPDFSHWHAVCIGETTAAAARRFGFHTTTAAKADLDSMAVCMEAAWHSTRKEEQQ